MLSLNNLKPNGGSRKKSKRVGRGIGSGKGTFSGKGCKGQNARSGNPGPWFEGGQTPLFRRTPKLRGFSNSMFKINYNIINLDDLENLVSKGIVDVDKKVLLDNGLIRKKDLGIKLLGNGEFKGKINIKLDKASKKAQEIIEKNGGKIEFNNK